MKLRNKSKGDYSKLCLGDCEAVGGRARSGWYPGSVSEPYPGLVLALRVERLVYERGIEGDLACCEVGLCLGR